MLICWNHCYFCDVQSICGKSESTVIDSSVNTAWTTEEYLSPNNKYLQFEFFTQVSISSIAIQTLCQAPKHVRLNASNDEGKTWITICEKK